MKRLRVVQIGTAHAHAADIMQTLRRLSDDFEVIGLCEPDADNRLRAREKPCYQGVPALSVQEALSLRPDAVFVETEEAKLAESAQVFAEAGVPVHMDKPGGTDLAHFERLVAVMRAKNLPLQLGYMYRFNPAVRYCRELVASHALGDIISVEAQMSVQHPFALRQWLGTLPGGMMLFLGCHLVDLVYTFMGEPDEVVPFNARTRLDGLDSLDYAFSVFRYPRGVSFIKACSAEVDGYNRRQLVVSGTKGTMVVQPMEHGVGEDFLMSTSAYVVMNGEPRQSLHFDAFTRYGGMLRNFAAAVRGEPAVVFGYDHELAVQRLTMRACGLDGR